MAKWKRRACVWNDSLQRWISPRTGKQYTDADYQKRCEQGRKVAAEQKTLAAYIVSPEYQQERAESLAHMEANAGEMRPLPGSHAWYVANARSGEP